MRDPREVKVPKTLAVWIDVGVTDIGEALCPTGCELPRDVDLDKCALFSAVDLNDVQRKYSDFTLLGTLAGGKVLVISTKG
jgi:hypothetical protein